MVGYLLREGRKQGSSVEEHEKSVCDQKKNDTATLARKERGEISETQAVRTEKRLFQ